MSSVQRRHRLVGRAQEFETLLKVSASAPSVVFVQGEAGVGKSRLIEELHVRLSRRSKTKFLVGHYYEEKQPSELSGIIQALGNAHPDLRSQALRPVAQVLRDLVPQLTERSPSGRKRSLIETQSQECFRALRELLIASGRVVLVLEDLNWAEDRSFEFLRFLLSSPAPEASLVLTSRSGAAPAFGGLVQNLDPNLRHAHLKLLPLQKESVMELAGEALGPGRLSPELTDYLCLCTGGIPFVLTEFLEVLKGDNDLQALLYAERKQAPVPPVVRDLVVKTLFDLPTKSKRLIETAAVIGSPCPASMMTDIASGKSKDSSLALVPALASGLIQEDSEGKVSFRHELGRRAVYEAIPGPSRRLLHQGVVEHMEAADSFGPLDLAEHFRKAGVKDRWVAYSNEAADLLLSQGEVGRACDLLQGALGDRSLGRADRMMMARKLGNACVASTTPSESAELLEQMIREANLPEQGRGELRQLLGLALCQVGEVEAGVEHLKLCLPELAKAPSMAARAMRMLAYPAVPSAPLKDHLEWLRKAKKTAARGTDAQLKSALLWDEAAILLTTGDPRGWKAWRRLENPRPPLDRGRYQARMLARMAEAAALHGYFERAREFCVQGIELCEKLKFPLPLGALWAVDLYLDWSMGSVEGLEDKAEDLITRFPEAPPLVLANLVIARIQLGAGRLDISGRAFAEVTVQSRIRGLLAFLPTAAAGLMSCHLSSSNPHEALEQGQSSLDMLRRKGIWTWGVDLVPTTMIALLKLGRTEEAATLLSEFVHGLEGRDSPAGQASLLYCQGLLKEARGESASAELFQEAVQGWSALPCPYRAALAEEAAGRVLFETDRRRAVNHLLLALNIEKVGGRIEGARIRQFLRKHGESLPHPWRGGRRSLGDELSEREKEILEMVERRLTYREIGNALRLSPKTVDAHLQRARRKLRQRGESPQDAIAHSPPKQN